MADLDVLARATGLDVAQLPEAQRKVLEELSDEEIRIITSVNERMRAAGADTEGYMAGGEIVGTCIW